MLRNLVAAAALLAAPSFACGANILVNTSSGGTGGPDCTLRDAIDAANTDLAVGGCPAGAGADVVQLPAAATITYTTAASVDQFGDTALPIISAPITIEGNGSTIERAATPCTINNTIEPGEFRLLRVSFAGTLTLRSTTVRNGCSDAAFGGSGGGISAEGGALTLERVTLRDNTAPIGGGARSTGPLTVRASVITANTATSQGAGIAASGLTDIAGSTFSANAVMSPFPGGGGGALLVMGFGIPTASKVRNTTFSGNSAFDGAAILLQDQSLELSFVTIANHTGGNALAGGIGFPLPGSPGPRFGLRGVWLTNNTPASCAIVVPPLPGFPVLSYTYEGVNLSSDASCAGALPVAAGQLQPLANYGGPTLTLRPAPGSGGLDAASNCLAFGGVDTIAQDQRGVARPKDADGNGTTSCDIGAVELDGGAAPVITAPAMAATLSDQVILFGASFGNAITLADADAGALPVQLEISVDQGTLSLASIAGLTFAIGDGSADTAMRFTGPLAAIAAALDGLAYTPLAAYTGADTFELTANDLGNTGESGAQVDTAFVLLQVQVRAALASLAPGNLEFGAVTTGTTSAARTAVLENTGNIPLTNLLIETSPSDFAATHNCPLALAPGASCTILVTLTPTANGQRLGVLAVSSNGTASPVGLVLRGTGQGADIFANGYE